MGKSPQEIFREFEDVDPELHRGRGDVKYHLGYSSDWRHRRAAARSICRCASIPATWSSSIRWPLGRMRAKQDRDGDISARAGHGAADPRRRGLRRRRRSCRRRSTSASWPATRSAARCTSSSTTRSASPRRREQGRSSTYATDVAKMLQIPIFHVNGEDPEAVAQVVRLAMDFRRDVPARRRDRHVLLPPPRATTKATSRRSRSRCCTSAIENRKTVREGYLEQLLKLGGITRDEADEIAAQQPRAAGGRACRSPAARSTCRGRRCSAACGTATAAGASAWTTMSRPASPRSSLLQLARRA